MQRPRPNAVLERRYWHLLAWAAAQLREYPVTEKDGFNGGRLNISMSDDPATILYQPN